MKQLVRPGFCMWCWTCPACPGYSSCSACRKQYQKHYNTSPGEKWRKIQ